MACNGGQGLIEATRAGTSLENRDNTEAGVTVPRLIQLPIKATADNEGEHRPEDEDNVNQAEEEVENNDETNQNRPATWFQIDMDKYDGIEMGITEDGLLWSCCFNPDQGDDADQSNSDDKDEVKRDPVGNYEDEIDAGRESEDERDPDDNEAESDEKEDEKIGLLQFYVYSPFDFKLVKVASKSIVGTSIRTSKEVKWVLNQETFNFLILLTNANEIVAFDVQKREFGPILRLKVSNPNQSLCYEDIQVMYDHKQILVIEKSTNQNVKSIVIFQFPPSWKHASFIDLEQFQIKLAIQKNLCAILRNTSTLTVSTWSQVIQNATSVVPITRRAVHSTVEITHQWHIDALPANRFSITMINSNFHFLNLDPPMVVVDETNGKAIYKLYPSYNPENAELVYRIKGRNGQLGDRFTRVVAFGDPELCRILIRNRMTNAYQVVSFNKNQQGVITNSVVSLPFRDWSPITWSNLLSRKKSILGMTFSKQLKLFAVLFAHENKFNVNIYEPSETLRLVKAFQIVARVTSKYFSIDEIKKVFMSFKPDLLLVKMTFDLSANDDDNDQDESVFTEVYCLPFMLGARQQQLFP